MPSLTPWPQRSPAASARPADPVQAAPSLCAGIDRLSGARRAGLRAGGRLGLYGFGAAPTSQRRLACPRGRSVVRSCGPCDARPQASRSDSSGAGLVGGSARSRRPARSDAAIIFAPAGRIVPAALGPSTPGGTVVLAGIHMTEIPAMSYADHLFGERDLRTVTANTRGDGEAFLRLARNLQIVPTVHTVSFARADIALGRLRAGGNPGSTVLTF